MIPLLIEDFLGVKLFDGGVSGRCDRHDQIEWLLRFIDPDLLHLEFGVYEGQSINAAAKVKPETTFYGFDSFQGLPVDWELGGKYVKADRFDLKGVLPKVRTNVKLVAGYFEDTLKPWLLSHREAIGFLHVDCDIYPSAFYVLETLDRHIRPGSILLFDELVDWRLLLDQPYDRLPRTKYTRWREHEWKALNDWMRRFDRMVIPVSRNWKYAAAAVVVK